MSPLLNENTLAALSTDTLCRLKAALIEILSAPGLAGPDRRTVQAALQVLDAVLRRRITPKPPTPSF